MIVCCTIVQVAVYNEHTSSTKGVTAAVLSFLCVACVFNVVGIFLSMENAFIVPIQTLQGPIGLYIWYSISGICAFISFLMYSILYPTQMRDNIDSDSEPDFTADVTHFGYAYWLLFTGTVLVGANVGLVHLARKSIESKVI
ncbi:putative clarin-1 [Apostichopus japonicus]|uniref:Putative clarin-1 n=1 Tax=Stichopus japonicus TaxID=307972 RepID=A0A2G8K8K4_STIJA|nr:putative clarin-1 [Apostichopus japonicus]